MKKALLLVLALVLCFALVGCGEKDVENNELDNNSNTSLQGNGGMENNAENDLYEDDTLSGEDETNNLENLEDSGENLEEVSGEESGEVLGE